MNRFSCARRAVVLLPLVLLSLRATPANEAAGRAVVKRYADTIVSVELVATVKVKVGDRDLPPREMRREANGTVISASGLTVTSLTLVDPQAQLEAGRGGLGGRGGGEVVGVDYKEVKLRLADGKEVPARFVLKDSDLDLAFMAPEADAAEAKREFAYVKLEQSVDGVVLGDYFQIGRAPKMLQRVPTVRATAVSAIVEKPRRFYLLTDQMLGTPVFDAEGRVLGISVVYAAGGGQAAVVMPAADIAEMAKQAAAAQANSAAEAKPAAAPAP